MKIPEFEIKTSGNEAKIWFASDIHYGHESHDFDIFKKYLDKANKEKWHIVLGGDLVETAIPIHLQQTMFSQNVDVTSQFEDIYELFRPLKDKIIVSVAGNHEDRIYRYTGFDASKALADKLGALYMPVGGYVNIKFGKQIYTLAVFHGSGGSSDPRKQCQRAMSVFGDADIVAIGHNHMIYAEKFLQYKVTDGVRRTQCTLALRTGSFLKYATYAQIGFMPLSRVGSPVVTIYKNEHLTKVDLDAV